MNIMPDNYLRPRRHTAKIQMLVDSLLNGRGDSDPGLRRAVELRVAAHSSRLSEGDGRLPAELASYVDKIAWHAQKLSLAPDQVQSTDIDVLRAEGLSDAAIEDAIHVTVLFNIMDRIADSLGFEIPSAEGFARVAEVLLKRGY